MLTLGSFFDGLGGWPLAAERAGIKPVWASEIEEYCQAVTAYHFPSMKQLGDITKLKAEDLEPVDIICAGSPCQGLSLSGKMKGLNDERSGLFVDSIKLVHGLRKLTGKPRYFVWENVPGAFITNKGNDFRAVLEEITKTEIPMPVNNKWAESGMVEWGGTSSLAWRTFDSQFWGSAQRRKRIFLVADFGGFTAGEILFERKSSAGDSSESQGEGQEAATDVGESIDSASICWEMNQPRNRINDYSTKTTSPTLTARMGTGGNQVPIVHSIPIENHPADKVIAFEDRHDEGVRFMTGGKTNTLTAAMGTGGNNVPLIKTTINETEVHGVGVFPQQAFDEYGEGKPLSTLKAQGGSYGGGSESLVYQKNVGALCMDDYKGANNQYVDQDKCVIQCGVRRLTPTECERLQNLPDGWTDVEYKGKPAPDSKRYKAIGNGMAQVCPDFIMKRIAEVNTNGQNEGHD